MGKTWKELQKEEEGRRRMKRAFFLSLVALLFFAAGMKAQDVLTDHSMREDLKRTRTLLEQSKCSVVILTTDQADMLDYGARNEITAKTCQTCHREPISLLEEWAGWGAQRYSYPGPKGGRIAAKTSH